MGVFCNERECQSRGTVLFHEVCSSIETWKLRQKLMDCAKERLGEALPQEVENLFGEACSNLQKHAHVAYLCRVTLRHDEASKTLWLTTCNHCAGDPAAAVTAISAAVDFPEGGTDHRGMPWIRAIASCVVVTQCGERVCVACQYRYGDSGPSL